jgi:hypothetical protein
MTAPLALDVTQLGFADPRENLRAVVDMFTPPASGRFVGGFDGSGFFFLEGYVERRQDALGGAVKLRWQYEDKRLVVFAVDGRPDDLVDVQLSVRAGSTVTTFNEIWQLSTMTR